MTCLRHEGKGYACVYLEFSIAFVSVSHSFLLEKLAAQSLDGYPVLWVKVLDGWLDPECGGE